MKQYDVVIVGAGASGLMCAAQAGYRGRNVLVIDHAKRPGKKILLSGGGRCNFTNRHVGPENYLSQNRHFAISALKRFSSNHFIELVERHGIDYHERDWGQLFCDDSSKAIVKMLLTECEWAGVALEMQTSLDSITRNDHGFLLETRKGPLQTESLVLATGGLSLPNAGATPWGLEQAKQLGLAVIPPRAGLVPFTLQPAELSLVQPLSGLALPAALRIGKRIFQENLLFTHRGLSGPVVLQISNYWQPGQNVHIDLFPGTELDAYLIDQRTARPKVALRTVLAETLSKRLAQALCTLWDLDRNLDQFSDKALVEAAQRFKDWVIKPAGTEGYRTAEVTLGGIDTQAFSSKTFEANDVKGLYVIGELLDVTGWLGGYNFQWAWASGYCAGQYV